MTAHGPSYLSLFLFFGTYLPPKKKKIKNVDTLLWFTRFRQDVTRFTQPFLAGEEEAAAEGESEAAAQERRRDGGIKPKEDFWGLREQREKGIWVAG